MDWRASCAAVIPCLNEARTIGSLVRAIQAYLTTVMVVDDGSNDATALLAQEAGAEVLPIPNTRGKGAALQAGWGLAHTRGFDWAIALDGDGQHAPEEIPKFFRCAEQTGAGLVVGNRMVEGATMPWVRRTVNRAMSRWLSATAGQFFPDSQCGFRLMKLSVWANLPITSAHFEIESEVLLAFVRAGERVEFVPIQAIYKKEQSKIHAIKDTVRWLRWIRQASREQTEHTAD